MTSDRYNAREAEPRWQKAWDERGIFATGNDWRCVYFVGRDNLPARVNLTPPAD